MHRRLDEQITLDELSSDAIRRISARKGDDLREPAGGDVPLQSGTLRSIPDDDRPQTYVRSQPSRCCIEDIDEGARTFAWRKSKHTDDGHRVGGRGIRARRPGIWINAVGQDVDGNRKGLFNASSRNVTHRGHHAATPRKSPLRGGEPHSRCCSPHAVHRDHSRKSTPCRDTQPTPREGRDHSHVQMHDIGRQLGEYPIDMVSGPRMNRQFSRQVSRHSMHGATTTDGAFRPALIVSGCGRHDVDVMTSLLLSLRQEAHLSLDPTGARGVAIGDVDDPHTGDATRSSRPPHLAVTELAGTMTCHRRRIPMSQDVSMVTLGFVHAHPDDESLFTAGTMARASHEGHRVVLITATDGAAGLASSTFAGDLASHRGAELRRSADILGVDALHCLGYADSGLTGDIPDGFAHQPTDALSAEVARIARDEGVEVLIGYDSAGGYGHPDHLQVHRVTRGAAALLGPDIRLFEATLPREPIATAVAIAASLRLTPGDFDPTEFASAFTPRAQITHRVNVRGFVGAKRDSMRAHASQASADDSTRTLAVLSRLPEPVFAALLGTEYYVAVRDDR
jgi:LmbE family N-acetylglucosaminyl deacetylase